MKKINFFIFVFAMVAIAACNRPTGETGAIEYVSDELTAIINKDAVIDTIAEGFQFTEGPLWIEQQKMLLFSDVPANIIYKWTEAKGKEVYLTPSGYTDRIARSGFLGSNGLALSSDGKLLVCQHGDRRIARMESPIEASVPEFTTVANAYDGKQLNSPNDLAITSNGTVYFTDPSYGLEKGMDDPKKEISCQGVYRLTTQGTVELLIDSIEQPNGIALMPDEKTLLVSNSDEIKKRWYAYDIDVNSKPGNARIFYDVSTEEGSGACDGFKIDKAGNVFATGPGVYGFLTEQVSLLAE